MFDVFPQRTPYDLVRRHNKRQFWLAPSVEPIRFLWWISATSSISSCAAGWCHLLLWSLFDSLFSVVVLNLGPRLMPQVSSQHSIRRPLQQRRELFDWSYGQQSVAFCICRGLQSMLWRFCWCSAHFVGTHSLPYAKRNVSNVSASLIFSITLFPLVFHIVDAHSGSDAIAVWWATITLK